MYFYMAVRYQDKVSDWKAASEADIPKAISCGDVYGLLSDECRSACRTLNSKCIDDCLIIEQGKEYICDGSHSHIPELPVDKPIDVTSFLFNDSLSGCFYNEWAISLFKEWHKKDPVDQKEIDRNEAAFLFQGNRNPFVDHPEMVEKIWSYASCPILPWRIPNNYADRSKVIHLYTKGHPIKKRPDISYLNAWNDFKTLTYTVGSAVVATLFVYSIVKNRSQILEEYRSFNFHSLF
ncbi:hypothetical protein EOPP23_13015 [Endozoicomonas sp. OPT23]|nr:hypothetical protein [Endozoicomonas sp. OPT23]